MSIKTYSKEADNISMMKFAERQGQKVSHIVNFHELFGEVPMKNLILMWHFNMSNIYMCKLLQTDSRTFTILALDFSLHLYVKQNQTDKANNG